MKFSEKYDAADEICPVCRRRYKKGQRINASSYCDEYDVMCADCYDYCFKDIRGGRTAALVESAVNLPVRLRPAQIQEKPLFRKGRKSARGYEYRMAYLTGYQLICDTLLWLALCIGARGALILFSGAAEMTVSAAVLELAIFAGSCFTAARDLCLLIKGIFSGMGHPRRLILAAALAVTLYPALTSFSALAGIASGIFS